MTDAQTSSPREKEASPFGPGNYGGLWVSVNHAASPYGVEFSRLEEIRTLEMRVDERGPVVDNVPTVPTSQAEVGGQRCGSVGISAKMTGKKVC